VGQPASEPVPTPAAAPAAALRALTALSDAVLADVGTAFFAEDAWGWIWGHALLL